TFASEMTDSAAQRQSTNTSCGNYSARSSESECVRCMINIAPDASAADRDGARNRIDLGVFDLGEVYHQTVIANSQAASIVAATANRNKQVVIAREVFRPHDVGDIHAPCD